MGAVVLPASRRVLSSGSTTTQFIPMSGWVPAVLFREVKALLQLRDRTANFEVAFALQTAAVDPDQPDAPVVKGSYVNTNTKSCTGLLDITTDVDADFYVRFGVSVRNGTGSTFERGEVILAVTGRD